MTALSGLECGLGALPRPFQMGLQRCGGVSAASKAPSLKSQSVKAQLKAIWQGAMENHGADVLGAGTDERTKGLPVLVLVLRIVVAAIAALLLLVESSNGLLPRRTILRNVTIAVAVVALDAIHLVIWSERPWSFAIEVVAAMQATSFEAQEE